VDLKAWTWHDGRATATEHLGRACLFVDAADGFAIGTLKSVELEDGVVDVDIAVGAERGFHGVVWRLQDDENYESFFVRPHQVGNPDAIQYTPVFNGSSSWQLYHGPGFWNPVAFPIGAWFRIRVAFSGERAEVYVGDLEEPALAIRELKRPVAPGRVGVIVGGPGIHVAAFSYDATGDVMFRGPALPPPRRAGGVVPSWLISDAFPESELASPPLEGRTWTRMTSEPSGLVDLSRVNAVRDGNDTVLARTVIRSDRAQTKRLDFGFSDRAVVYLNGQPLYRGDDTYRSRDYRFLGSIGYFDALYLPLVEGENELVVAVAEDFGGWGIQARFEDPSGLALD
jgi:hypothetical protein